MADSEDKIGCKKQGPQSSKLSGRCLCGGVKFTVEGPLRDVVSCYCSECRQTSGNFVSATATPVKQLHFLEQSSLAWYKSKLAQRGFCRRCGANLFWIPVPQDGSIRIMAGCLESTTGLSIKAHIFVDSKSDFHEISGTAPCYSRGGHDVSIPK